MKHGLRNGLYGAAILAASPWLGYRSLRTGRYRRGVRDKLLGLSGVEQPHHRPPTFWLHGVSVGEVQLLRPLVDRLAAQRPDLSFAVSTSTDSGMDLAHSLFQEPIRTFYFPLDFSWAVKRTLEAIQPSMLILGELEVWPNLLSICHQRNISLAIINGRLSERSFRGYQRFRWLLRSTFAQLKLVCAQNETYAERFRQLGVASKNVITTGSIKFDNAETNRQAPQVQQLRQLVGLKSIAPPVFVLGSSQAPEERAAVEAFLQLRSRYPKLKLIIVPRHRERFAEAYQQLAKVLSEANAAASPQRLVRRSELHSPIADQQWDVLLVDTIGELRWWWGVADLALVGGSFGSRGGQNMIEPAAYGASVAFGPRTENFRDIVAPLLAGDAAERLPATSAISAWLVQQLSDPAAALQRGRRAQQLVLSQQGATDRTVTALLHEFASLNLCK